MALSKKEREILRVALAQQPGSERIIDQIEKLDALKDIDVIADTSTATAEDVGDKVNEILNALK